MQTKEYIVALKEGVNYDQFWSEMEDSTSGLPHIPDRAVSITNNRTPFKRICEYALTDDEADRIRNDPRVEGIEIPVKNNPLVSIVHSTTQNNSFDKTTSSYGDNVNWGLIRHTRNTNVYGTGTTTAEKYNYVLDGTGVDVVINDSGIQADHPEFAGRVNTTGVNWNALAPNYSDNSYTDINGHGTHVASIVAGKTFGWAKGANILSLKYEDSNSSGDVLDCFEALLVWHNAKTNNRPTVMNMSWGFGASYEWLSSLGYFALGGNYQGNAWVRYTTNDLVVRGIIPDPNLGFFITIPYHSATYDVALAEVIDAGVIAVRAAGNNGHKIDKPNNQGGTGDYDNYFITAPTLDRWYYHRGASPTDPRAIVVGNIDSVVHVNGKDQRSAPYKSSAGPRVDVWAAGTNILAATSNIDALGPYGGSGGVSYNHGNPAFKQINISGTSMAAPQVTGIIALHLQHRPLTDIKSSTNCETVKSWLIDNSLTDQIYSPSSSTTDYTNLRSLLGGPNRIAYQPIQGLTKVKDATGTWRNVADIKVKTATNTWANVKTVWTKTVSGWRQTF